TARLFVTIALVDGRSPATRPQHTVYVIDTSASLGAYESSTHTRLMLAARWIRQAMQGMQPDDRVALVDGGAAARLLVGWTRDPRSLHRALATLEPGGGSSEMPQALRIASVLSHEHRGSIVLLSDGLGFE